MNCILNVKKTNEVHTNLVGVCMADSKLRIFNTHFEDRFMEVIVSSNLRTILGIFWMDSDFKNPSSESDFLAAEFGYERSFPCISVSRSVIKHVQEFIFLI
jgi:hypothetical protein